MDSAVDYSDVGLNIPYTDEGLGELSDHLDDDAVALGPDLVNIREEDRIPKPKPKLAFLDNVFGVYQKLWGSGEETVPALPENAFTEDTVEVLGVGAPHQMRFGNNSRLKRLTCFQRLIPDSTWFLLLILGVVASFVAWTMDELNALLAVAQKEYIKAGSVFFGEYILYILWVVILSLLAVFVTSFMPIARGSGIPELKGVLAGFKLETFLSFRTLVVKVIGTVLAIGAGLVVGKEGPFVHTAAIIANLLLRLPVFSSIAKNDSLRNHVIGAAAAVGVSSTFGAPIGGVLFSIEVTTTFYSQQAYWKGMFASICGAFVFKELAYLGQSRDNEVSLFWTSFNSLPYNANEIWLFAILGVICGVFGGLFILLHRKTIQLRRRYRHRAVQVPGFHPLLASRRSGRIWNSNKYVFTLIVAVLLGVIQFPFGGYMIGNLREVANDLFHEGSLEEIEHLYFQNWGDGSAVVSLTAFTIFKALFAVICLTVPVPCGLITPVFAVGAGLGRLFGEVTILGFTKVTAGGYAVVGAAALTAGVTGTISIAVIVFELTSQLSYMLPVLLATLIAKAVANVISTNIYSSIAELKGLPCMPTLDFQRSYQREVCEFMEVTHAALPRKVSRKRIQQLLEQTKDQEIAIVDTEANRFYIGSADRSTLESLSHESSAWTKEVAERSSSVLRGSTGSSISLNTPDSRSSSFDGDDEENFEDLELDLVNLDILNLDWTSFHFPHNTLLDDVLVAFSVHKRQQAFVTVRKRLFGVVRLLDLQRRHHEL